MADNIMHKCPPSAAENPDLQGCDRPSNGVNALNEQLKADLSSHRSTETSGLRSQWDRQSAQLGLSAVCGSGMSCVKGINRLCKEKPAKGGIQGLEPYTRISKAHALLLIRTVYSICPSHFSSQIL